MPGGKKLLMVCGNNEILNSYSSALNFSSNSLLVCNDHGQALELLNTNAGTVTRMVVLATSGTFSAYAFSPALDQDIDVMVINLTDVNPDLLIPKELKNRIKMYQKMSPSELKGIIEANDRKFDTALSPNETTQGTQRSVLIVEDNELNQLLLNEVMVNLGCHTVCVSEYSSACLKAAVTRFDLVITDVSLPDGNGIDLIHFLRKSLNKHSPIILISGLSYKELFLRYTDVHADHIFLKPINIKELSTVVKEMFKDVLTTGKENNSDEQYAIDTIKRIFGSDVQLFEKTIREFIVQLNEVVEVLTEVRITHDWEKLVVPFHGVCNTSGYFDAEKLSALLRQFTISDDKNLMNDKIDLILHEVKSLLNYCEKILILKL